MTSSPEKKVVLAIAGSDPSGGAGVQADLKTLSDCGVRGISAITAITAQTDQAVIAIHPTPADILSQQLSTACKKQIPDAVKIGMVATQANIRVISWFLKQLKTSHVILDPILHSSSGIALLESKATAFYRQELFPLATVITPNLSEASALAGMQVANLETMRTAAKVIYDHVMQFRSQNAPALAILIKGGHLQGDAVDMLYDGQQFLPFSAARIPGKNPRGTGCRFSSALAASLAKGRLLPEATSEAKEYLRSYIASSR